MMAEQLIWWDYLIFDDNGSTETLQTDTPQHIREEFEEYLALKAAHPDVCF